MDFRAGVGETPPSLAGHPAQQGSTSRGLRDGNTLPPQKLHINKLIKVEKKAGLSPRNFPASSPTPWPLLGMLPQQLSVSQAQASTEMQEDRPPVTKSRCKPVPRDPERRWTCSPATPGGNWGRKATARMAPHLCQGTGLGTQTWGRPQPAHGPPWASGRPAGSGGCRLRAGGSQGSCRPSFPGAARATAQGRGRGRGRSEQGRGSGATCQGCGGGSGGADCAPQVAGANGEGCPVHPPRAQPRALAQGHICPEEGTHFLILTKVPHGLEGPPRSRSHVGRDWDRRRPQCSPSARREELGAEGEVDKVRTPSLPSAGRSASGPTSLHNTPLLPEPSGASGLMEREEEFPK